MNSERPQDIRSVYKKSLIFQFTGNKNGRKYNLKKYRTLRNKFNDEQKLYIKNYKYYWKFKERSKNSDKSCLYIGRSNILNMAILFKLFYKVNALSIKIQKNVAVDHKSPEMDSHKYGQLIFDKIG